MQSNTHRPHTHSLIYIDKKNTYMIYWYFQYCIYTSVQKFGVSKIFFPPIFLFN